MHLYTSHEHTVKSTVRRMNTSVLISFSTWFHTIFSCLWTALLFLTWLYTLFWLYMMQKHPYFAKHSQSLQSRHAIRFATIYFRMSLKLYCRYLYTRPCMINHIWGLKQLWLQVNGHAWFHLQRLRWPVRNVEGAKNSKWKYMYQAGFEPTPRQSTTGKLQRLRPLGHTG